MQDDEGPLGEELLVLAEAQVAAGQFGVAVVIAQTVIEASVEFAFGLLFFLNVPRSAATMDALLPDRTFMNRATRTLWKDLTYETSRNRRRSGRRITTTSSDVTKSPTARSSSAGIRRTTLLRSRRRQACRLCEPCATTLTASSRSR
jgi:hypothetical protein